MTAEIVAIGTELLLGDIVNTNAQWLARRLAMFGVSVYRQTVVGDNMERIQAALASAFDGADLVITTGGLGPTEDDLTKEAAAAYFGLPMETDEPSLAAIRAFFAKRHMAPANEKQAAFPKGATILPNGMGTAPGCVIEKDGKTLAVLPGPPFEMTNMFETGLAPILAARQTKAFYARELRMVGIGESQAEERIADIIHGQSNPGVGTYAGNGELRFRVMASGETEAAAKALADPLASRIYERLGEFIYGENEDSMEGVIIARLKAKGLTVATAESCTGGLVTGRLVNAAGASAALREGFVTYSNAAKTARLGVPPETLARCGAVSEETARAMAEGAARAAGAEVGLATTGIAGPDGGTAEKPVGLVYIAVCVNGRTTVERHQFGGDRARVRMRAVSAALDLLRRSIG